MTAKMGPPVKMSEANNIVAELRRKLGLKQSELAALLGTTPTAVSYWENGERAISGPVERLCKILLKYPDILTTLD